MTRLLVVIVLAAVIAATMAERKMSAEKNVLEAIMQANPKVLELLRAGALNEIQNQSEGKEAQEQSSSSSGGGHHRVWYGGGGSYGSYSSGGGYGYGSSS